MKSSFENILMTTGKAGMIAYLETHPEDFAEAMELAISDKQPYARRSAFFLWSCMAENDKRVKKFTGRIIGSLSSKKDDHQRELLKVLLKMKLSGEQESYLFGFCVSLWEKIQKKPSVRYTAFRFMIRIAGAHKELKRELFLLTQPHYLESLSPVAQRAVLRLLCEPRAKTFLQE